MMLRFFLIVTWGLSLQTLSAQNFIRAYATVPFGGTPGLLIPEDATQLSNGNYLFSAFSGYLTLTDPDGEPLSTFRIAKSNANLLDRVNLSQLADAGANSAYIAGLISADSLFFLKIDLSGNLLWQQGYHTPSNNFKKMIATQDGGMLALTAIARGSTQNAIAALIKIDANGNLQWQRKYYNANPGNGRLLLYDVSQTANGDYLITGATTPAVPARGVVARLSSTGEVLWAKEIAPTNNSNEFGRMVQELANGQIKLVVNNPTTTERFGVVVLSAVGDFIRAEGYGGVTGSIADGQILSSGDVVAALANTGTVLRIAADGNPVFAYDYLLPGGSFFVVNKVFASLDGGLASYGGYTFSLFGDFTPSLFKTAATGETPPGFSSPLTLVQAGYSPVLSNTTLTDSAFSALQPYNIEVTPVDALFDTLYAIPALSVQERTPQANFFLFPNPATDRLFLSAGQARGMVRIMNAAGQVVLEADMRERSRVLEVGHLPAGMYVAEWWGKAGRRAIHLEIR